jgi:GTP-binding protein EngB required for normal cell division
MDINLVLSNLYITQNTESGKMVGINTEKDFDIEKFKKMINPKRNENENKPKVIAVGRSNVGKSTFVRLMTGKSVRVGKKPGVTLKIREYDLGNYLLVDLPGFGYMHGLDKTAQEQIKNEIIRYIEDNQKSIVASVLIIDAKSFLEIVERWDKRGEIPIDIEMFDFLTELELNPILVVNKMDKIKRNQWDSHLDKIVETLGYLPPWRQWLDFVVPTILKNEVGLEAVKNKINYHVRSSTKSGRSADD